MSAEHEVGECAMMGPMATRPRDALLARGNTSDVYHWGGGAVVKVLRPGIPDEWAAREALTTQLIHAAGLPAPAVLDVTTVRGRPGIVFERVHGVSMWEQMQARPRDIPRLARLMGELQAEVNSTRAPAGLPRLVDRLHDNVERAALLSAPEREIARTAVRRLSHERHLCHFDMHPNNVLMGPRGPVIIDWFDAAAGSPAADVVRSSVLIREDAAGGHLPCMDSAIIDLAHGWYLESVIRTRDIDGDVLLSWEPTVLAARLGERVPQAVLRATHRMWRDIITAQTSRLAEGLRSAEGSTGPAACRDTSPAR